MHITNARWNKNILANFTPDCIENLKKLFFNDNIFIYLHHENERLTQILLLFF